MKLASYLEREELKPARFAERIGVPASTITRILSGARRPRLDTAAKIAAGTDGAVAITDLVVMDDLTEPVLTAPAPAAALNP